MFLSGAFSVQSTTSTINFLREINCVSLNLNMATRKIYSLVICYDEDTGVVEYVEERIDRETELPDTMFETKMIEELDEFLEQLPKVIEVGEA